MGTGKVVKVSVTSYGVVNCVGVVGSVGDRSAGCSMTLVVRGSNKLVLEKTEKSIDVLSDV